MVRLLRPADHAEWLRMRQALWPDDSPERHLAEMESFSGLDSAAVFVAERPGGGLGGFLEVSLHQDAEGCATSPVGYVEGWYVDPDLRRRGVGGLLLSAAEDWARSRGCREMASDARADNAASLAAHCARGYDVAARVVLFRKSL